MAVNKTNKLYKNINRKKPIVIKKSRFNNKRKSENEK
jgi:hypothetical protein